MTYDVVMGDGCVMLSSSGSSSVEVVGVLGVECMDGRKTIYLDTKVHDENTYFNGYYAHGAKTTELTAVEAM
jgi:hypothetical protein